MWSFEVLLVSQTRVTFHLVPGVAACLVAYIATPALAALLGGLVGRRHGDVERGRRAGLLACLAALNLAGAGLFVYVELTPLSLPAREACTVAAIAATAAAGWLVHRRWRPSFGTSARLMASTWVLWVALFRAPRQIMLDTLMARWHFVARDGSRLLLLALTCAVVHLAIGLAWRWPRRALAAAVLVAPAAVYAIVPPAPPPPAPAAPPRGDVFVVVLDSLRFDHTSLSPEGGDLTPALAALAARGLSFSAAHSPSNQTTHSLPLLLGRYDGASRATLKTRWTGLHASWFESLPARLQAAGYRLHLLSDCAYMALEGLEAYRWDTVAARAGQWFRLAGLPSAWAAILARDPQAMGYVLGDRQPCPDGEGPAPTLDRLLASDPAPGFFLLHLAAPHDPYDRPPYDAKTLPPADVEGARDVLARFGQHEGRVTPEEAAVYRTFYRRAVRAADEHLAAVLEVIERHGRARDALVVVTADHGESLGEDGYVGHGSSLHVQEHHVPLVIAGAGVPAGRVVTRPVSNGRLADTIAAWAGLPSRGRSLLRELAPAAPPVSVEEAGWRLLWTRDEILLRRPSDWAHRQPFELYDAAADPRERHDHFREDHHRLRRLLGLARELGRPLFDQRDRVADADRAAGPSSPSGIASWTAAGPADPRRWPVGGGLSFSLELLARDPQSPGRRFGKGAES
jgi:arylsulfatase A-like enzyme